MIVTGEAAWAITPALGACAVTSPAGVRLDSTTIVTVNPACSSAATASSRDMPTTSGTAADEGGLGETPPETVKAHGRPLGHLRAGGGVLGDHGAGGTLVALSSVTSPASSPACAKRRGGALFGHADEVGDGDLCGRLVGRTRRPPTARPRR